VVQLFQIKQEFPENFATYFQFVVTPVVSIYITARRLVSHDKLKEPLIKVGESKGYSVPCAVADGLDSII